METGPIYIPVVMPASVKFSAERSQTFLSSTLHIIYDIFAFPSAAGLGRAGTGVLGPLSVRGVMLRGAFMVHEPRSKTPRIPRAPRTPASEPLS